jgi:hypothetical protein
MIPLRTAYKITSGTLWRFSFCRMCLRCVQAETCRHEEQQTAKPSHQNKPGALPHSSLSLSEGRLPIRLPIGRRLPTCLTR